MQHNDNDGPDARLGEQAGEEARQMEDEKSETGQDGMPLESGDEVIMRLKEEIDHYKDQFLRAMAEMDNMKRRHERDRTDTVKYALEGMFKDILPVLDSFEQALPDHEESSDDSFVEGMKKVKRQLLANLQKHGLEPITAVGQSFDPNVHQGIQRIESDDVKAEQVFQEFAKGYTLNGRLLRPSMVSVLVPKN